MALPPSDLRRPTSCQESGLGDERVILSRNGARMTCRTATGGLVSGLDFVSQDALGIGGHPALREAAMAAMEAGAGFRSTGLAPLAGLSEQVLELEARLSAFLRLGQATVFPSGTEANRAALRAILKPGDHVIIDADAHPALAEAARAKGVALHRSPPGSVDAVERRLSRLRRHHPSALILVAVSAIAATTAVRAELPALIDLCRERKAALLVDVTHDLGAMGATGRGVMELDGCLGRVDVVTGSFSKTFGAAGGFVASREPGIAASLRRMRVAQGQAAALPALLATVILRAFDLVSGPEGVRRRLRLMGNVGRLRNRLADDGWELTGRDAPFVTVRLPYAVAPSLTLAAEGAGVLLDLLAAPVVAGHAPRWRIHLRADHGVADIDSLAAAISQLPGSALARRSFARMAAARREG